MAQSPSRQQARTFEDKPATRERVPLLVGLYGPSGGGKTFSALRLATGIQRVTGGDIYVVDTEARRALHYADRFKFRHIAFGSPFGPLDYLAAVEHCVSKGARIVIVDSMSHEHEGPGGVLEMHERELDRIAGDDWKKRERSNFLAWARPKAERRRMINTLLQFQCNFVFCFRAKEKIKIEKGKDPQPLGWMPIAGEEFVYEQTVNALLPPGSAGVPSWDSGETGEKAIIKLPEQFKALFAARRPFDEDTGEQLARWAEGGAAPASNGRAAINADAWFAYWSKRGIDEARVLAAIGKAAPTALDAQDVASFKQWAEDLKAKRTTVGELFPELAPPEDDETATEGEPTREAGAEG